jgi:hypothetical protein
MTLTATEIVEKSISIENRYRRKKKFTEEYPDYIPVFIKYYDSDSIFTNILHKDIPFMRLLFIVRKKRSISPSTGIMTLIEYEDAGEIRSVQVPAGKTIGEISHDYLHNDGFLYLNIMTENVFGGNMK